MDTLFDAINNISKSNSPFDQILWDDELKVLSFRYTGYDRYVNLWLNRPLNDKDDHHCETNGGPSVNSKILWEY